ncbi:Oidioi.mRNA.OKI2018_I69.XSR.g15113.t1.cds [Oikopleura dioica]|uniref:Oidioi.mRNA.OKI2018_I69.XSR.g15113.t1.cds n=1 Tax=Oikopleura dioica TaxID=34765 RepID=A0ABN7SJ64_OIKDI|nr:Oidioi.mRNA.OKI2018_I69.XSR.g15113.t1.cds [Oikopleura dioica]
MSEEKEKILWGGRFEKSPDELLWKYNASINLCKKLWKEDLEGSKVFAAGLEKLKIISNEELVAIHAGLDKISSEWAAEEFLLKKGDEDIHTANERRLGEIIGTGIAGKLHTGRSRNEQSICELEHRLRKLIKAILQLAEENLDVMMPSFTHFQPAQVTTFGHWLVNHAEGLRSVLRRFNLIESHQWCPLGAGAIAGNAFGIDREFLSKELKFPLGPTLNSIHTSGSREAIVDFLFCISSGFTVLSRFCEDLIIFCSPNFNFVKIGQEFCTGSSLMPQKQNPDALELIRGKAGTSIGRLTGMLSTIKNLPSGYNKDLQEDKSAMFSSFEEFNDALQLSLAEFPNLLQTAIILRLQNENSKKGS